MNLKKKEGKARTTQNERDTKRKKKNGEIEEKNKEKMQQTGRKKKNRTVQQRKTEKMRKKRETLKRL